MRSNEANSIWNVSLLVINYDAGEVGDVGLRI